MTFFLATNSPNELLSIELMFPLFRAVSKEPVEEEYDSGVEDDRWHRQVDAANN